MSSVDPLDLRLEVVADPARPLVALQDDSGWRDAEPEQVGYVGCGKDHPLTLMDRVPELLV